MLVRALGLALGLVLAAERIADACGGCFVPPSTTESPTVVTDHRMALSIGKTQTVLWDQIKFQGAPKDFAWVLPVRAGARVELAQDRFLAALDATTAPVVVSPPPVLCPPSRGSTTSYDSSGCGAGFSSSRDDPFGSEYGSGFGAYDAGFMSSGEVELVDQRVVGPYLTVVIRSGTGESIGAWLRDNSFAVPMELEPTLDLYAKQGMDFLALKMHPAANVRAMQPVRSSRRARTPPCRSAWCKRERGPAWGSCSS